MATSKIELQYDLRQNSNSESSAYGKWYPFAVRNSTLSLKGLANHISGHGTVYTNDVVTGVLSKFTSCMIELVTQGIAVKLDGLGTFYPTLEATGASSPVGYDISSKLIGLHIRFTPENAGEDKISSRVMAGKVPFKQRMLFDLNGVPKKIKNGELVDYGTDNDDEQEPDDNNG